MKNIPKEVFFGFIVSQPKNREIRTDQCLNYGSHIGDILVHFGRIHFKTEDEFYSVSANGFYNTDGEFLCGIDGVEVKTFMNLCYDQNVRNYEEAQGILQDMLDECIA